jgi:hypothetical protein
MSRAALSLVVLALAAGEASAQSAAVLKAARELVESLKSRFGREVAEEGAENLERRFAYEIHRFGDDAARAAQKVGPRFALKEIQRHGSAGARILSRWGDDGARLLSTDAAGAMRVYASLGEEGVAVMLRQHGKLTAARLPELAPAISKSGRTADVLAVLDRYGDRACSFIWRNKGVIFGGAVLAAFLANPVPYLDGVAKLADVPVGHIAASTNWTVVFLGAALLLAGLAAVRMLILRPRRPVAKTALAD